MKKLALLLVAGLAALAGTARAGTPIGFVQGSVVPAAATVALPSAAAPNAAGTVALPAALTAPPAQPQVLDAAQLEALWMRAGGAYGIPWQVLAAINKVESNFGRNMGPSSAGAIGWMQFMPSTWLMWGTDGNGDGIADPWNAEDAVYSAARYLAASGGQSDISAAIFSYNHAQWYVDEVLQLAGLFGNAGVDATFSLDRLQQSLDQAEAQVGDANVRMVAALGLARQLGAQQAALLAKAARSTLLSNRLALEQQAGQVGFRKDAAAAEAAAAQSELASAQAALAAARQGSQAASFAPGAGTMLGAPAYSGRYVFPVGGGAGIVSVSHSHHDYPAADIAAPENSPVYALSDATVVLAWHLPDPRCGIGMTLRTTDGLVWTYCHLAYLEPGVVAGVGLTAGTAVGLAGHTGDASGPHLHLQLHPASSYPQDEAWFQAFAGSAFTWQDAAPAGRSLALAAPPERGSNDVFATVPSGQPPAAGPVIAFSTR